MTKDPFIKGATAILQVAIEQFRMSLNSENLQDRLRYLKAAYILTDDAVELAATTCVQHWIGINPKRKFPPIIDQIQQDGRITNEMANSLKTYHSTRNDLYHRGWLIYVSEDGAKGYIELALGFFSEIFLADLERSLLNDPRRQFLFKFSDFIKFVSELAKNKGIPIHEDSGIDEAIEKLINRSIVNNEVLDVYNLAIEICDHLIPSAPNPVGVDVTEPAYKLEECIEEFKQILS